MASRSHEDLAYHTSVLGLDPGATSRGQLGTFVPGHAERDQPPAFQQGQSILAIAQLHTNKS